MKKTLLVITVLILPSISFASIDQNLVYGQKNTSVSELQDFLVNKGYINQSTGFFGPSTVTAVKKFQLDNGLPSTGYVGSLTRGKINSELNHQVASPTQIQIQGTKTLNTPGCTTGAKFNTLTGANCSTPVRPTVTTFNQNSLQSTSNTPDLPTIVSSWSKRTAYIECYWGQLNSNTLTYTQTVSGSGYLMLDNGTKLTLVTNKHMVYDQNYGLATECDFAFPDDKLATYFVSTIDRPSYSIGNYVFQEIPIEGNISAPSNGADVAFISGMVQRGAQYYKPAISLEDRAKSGNHKCDANPPTGSAVAILGYPSYGTGAGQIFKLYSKIEPTVTEGIISGTDGTYLTTSAKIEHGNSGGLAIDEKNNCYIGIPTASITGEIESLGRILPASLIFK